MSVRYVSTTDGLRLAVYEQGDRANPTILAVHGYPDNHTIWDDVSASLADRYHVVSYDVRGAGDSGRPRHQIDYRLSQLEADLVAVIDEVSPDEPVHLLGHDWGSIQAWHAITGERARTRVKSFTSISGPCLDHVGEWFRTQLKRPTPRRLREMAIQLAFSGYIGFFQLPVVPELAWRSRLLPRVLRRLERFDPAADRPGRPSIRDGLHGLGLYRANMSPRLSRPTNRRADVPVQVIAPTRDPFVTAPVQSDIGRWVPQSWVRCVPGGHWLPRTRPDVVARCTAELVDHIEHDARPRGLRQARVDASRPAFADQLVLITGAGNGIGREMALSFAKQGAEVIAADVDPGAAKRTVEFATQLGSTATPYQVDVSDSSAMAGFAEWVRGELGVPDIVVNNAGIGIAGPFTETALSDWERVTDVNFWGVLHGCRLFAQQMRERGEGGRIINIVSAAAYVPSRTLSAYATMESAVLTLSQCLRAELASSGITVSAVCPGFVDTNIAARARDVRSAEGARGDRQRTAATTYRRRNFSAKRAARDILRAIERNKAIAPITAEAKVGLVLSRVAPKLLRAAAHANVAPGLDRRTDAVVKATDAATNP